MCPSDLEPCFVFVGSGIGDAMCRLVGGVRWFALHIWGNALCVGVEELKGPCLVCVGVGGG